MITNNITIKESVRKMAGIMRNVVFLSLAVNLFEIYGFVREPGQVRDMISIGLGIAGTVLIWLLSKALGQEKKQALLYWLAAGALGYIRWGFVDPNFQFNLFSIILMAVFIIFAVKIFTWTKNGLLA